MAALTTRRGLLRATAAAVGGFASAQCVSGAGNREEGPHDDSACSGVEPREGYLYFPERYRGCVRFQLVTELQVFRASVGRGPEVYRNDLREYTAYGIRYAEEGTGTTEDEGVLILAVPSPDHEESPSLFEYYLPRTPFQFTESKGRFVFQRDRSKPRTQVRRTEFVRVV